MPPAAAAGIGLLGGFMQARGARQQMQNAQQQLSPQQILLAMQQYNPGLFAALTGGDMSQFRGGQYEQIANIAQNPGYIDPRLMNAPYLQSAQKAQTDLVAAQGQIGRSGAQGGLANAYSLANKAAQTQRDVGLGQQYALWREQQRRQDLDWLQQMYSGLMGQATGTQGQLAGLAAQTPTNSGLFGNALGAGLGAYGTYKSLKNEQDAIASGMGGMGGGMGGFGGPGFSQYQPPPMMGGISGGGMQGGGFYGGGAPIPTYPTGPVGLFRS